MSLLSIQINAPAVAGEQSRVGEVAGIPPVRGHGFDTPMIPGAREPGMLTTFGVVAAIIPDWPKTMDAATIAARQREGGGAPSERRRPRQGSTWTRLTQTLRRVLIGADRT